MARIPEVLKTFRLICKSDEGQVKLFLRSAKFVTEERAQTFVSNLLLFLL